MALQQILGTGTTIAFATSAFQAAMNWESIRVNLGSRPVVPTTKLNATQPSSTQYGGHTSIPGELWDAPVLTVEIQWDPLAAAKPPMNAAAETVTITWADGSTLSGSGYISSIGEITAAIDGLLKATITVQGTGLWS